MTQTLIMATARTVLSVATLALAGCASSLVGYDAQTTSSCPRNEGVGCTPVSEVYKRAMAGTLPGQAGPGMAAPAAGPADLNLSSAAMRPAMSSGMPVRTAPRLLRIWFAPWKDTLDVLHDQRHSYVTLDNGRWLLEHNQQRLFQQFGATRLVQGGGDPAGGTPRAADTPAPTPAPTRQAPGAKTAPMLPPLTAPGLPGGM